jgi:hypothetical protein
LSLGVSQQSHFSLSFGFWTKHVLQFHLLLLPNRAVNDGDDDSVDGLEDTVELTNDCFVPLSLGVSQQAHFSLSFGFWTKHVLQSHLLLLPNKVVNDGCAVVVVVEVDDGSFSSTIFGKIVVVRVCVVLAKYKYNLFLYKLWY